LSFAERKDMLVQLLRSFKCRVATLLRGSCLEEYALNVGKLLKESKLNRINNDLKQQDIVAGRKRQGPQGKQKSK
jgi:hypothetical protein